MNRFAPLLRKLHDRIDLPQPTRSRIILELAADMEDTYRAYLERGIGEAEAAEKTAEKYDFSDEALRELIAVHETFFRRLLYRVSGQAQSAWERTLLIFALLTVAALAGHAYAASDFLKGASIFLWPVLGLSAAAGLLAFRKLYFLFIKKDHNLRTLRSGVGTVAFLGLTALAVGVFGYFVELYRSGGAAMILESKLFHVVTMKTMDLLSVADWLTKISSLVMTSLLAAIFTAMLWFLLVDRILRIERAEAALLLEYGE